MSFEHNRDGLNVGGPVELRPSLQRQRTTSSDLSLDNETDKETIKSESGKQPKVESPNYEDHLLPQQKDTYNISDPGHFASTLGDQDDDDDDEDSVCSEDVDVLMRYIPEYSRIIKRRKRKAKKGDHAIEEEFEEEEYLQEALRRLPSQYVDRQNEYGNSLLHLACANGCYNLAEILLENGANVNLLNQRGEGCLHFACHKTSLSIEIVHLLLRFHIDVNTAEIMFGCTPLHYAAGAGQLQLCELLVKSGANVQLRDFDQCSCIDYAVDSKSQDVADYLKDRLNLITSLAALQTLHHNPNSAEVAAETNEQREVLRVNNNPSTVTTTNNNSNERYDGYSSTSTNPGSTSLRRSHHRHHRGIGGSGSISLAAIASLTAAVQAAEQQQLLQQQEQQEQRKNKQQQQQQQQPQAPMIPPAPVQPEVQPAVGATYDSEHIHIHSSTSFSNSASLSAAGHSRSSRRRSSSLKHRKNKHNHQLVDLVEVVQQQKQSNTLSTTAAHDGGSVGATVGTVGATSTSTSGPKLQHDVDGAAAIQDLRVQTDLLQLPWIEATNELRAELVKAKEENQQLKALAQRGECPQNPTHGEGFSFTSGWFERACTSVGSLFS